MHPAPLRQGNKSFWIICPGRLSLGRTQSPSPRHPGQRSLFLKAHTRAAPCPSLGAELVGAGGVPEGVLRGVLGRTAAMPGRCQQHTQGSAYLASSFGAHCGAHFLVVPRHHPFPRQAPSPLKPPASTQPSMLRVVAPSGVCGSGSGSRQQQAAGGSEARLGTASPCWHSHSLQLSRGLAITRIRLSS